MAKLGTFGQPFQMILETAGLLFLQLVFQSRFRSDVVNLGNRRATLFYNHSHTERFPLSFAASFDDCVSWSAPFTVEEDSGEFPSAILDSEGLIHVSYAFSSPGEAQRRIKHVVVDLKYVKITSQ